MPNLYDVINDPAKKQQSVNRMMSGEFRRSEVVINHGIKNSEDLDAWVRQAPMRQENIAEYHKIIDAQNDSQR